MTATTIKVDSTLRDRLKEQAAAEGRNLGEHLEHLLQREERRLRMEALRDAIARTPAALRDAYEDEVRNLDSAVADDGLA